MYVSINDQVYICIYYCKKFLTLHSRILKLIVEYTKIESLGPSKNEKGNIKEKDTGTYCNIDFIDSEKSDGSCITPLLYQFAWRLL